MQPHIIPRRHGMFWHVFCTNAETGKKGYLGAYSSEAEATQHAVEAVGIEGDYEVFQSRHRDSSLVKQEYKHKKFVEGGDLWKNLRPIRNLGRKQQSKRKYYDGETLR